MSSDDKDVLATLYGTEVLELATAPDGTTSHTLIRQSDGYWHANGHWGHPGVSAVLVVKNLHPAFVANQEHTIWEHPQPSRPLEPLALWRRAVFGSDGQIEYIKPAKPQSDWFDLSAPGLWARPSHDNPRLIDPAHSEKSHAE